MAKPLVTPQSQTQIVDALVSRHGGHLRGERFSVEARLDGETVVARVTLANPDRTYVYHMESAVETSDSKVRSVAEGLELALDFLDWYLGEYFRAERELLLPLDWKPHRFGDHEIMARGDVHNEVLEDLADAWLRGERPEVPPHLDKGRARRKH